MRLLLLLSSALALTAADGYQSSDGTAGLGALTRPVPLSVQADTGLSPGEGTMVRRIIPWGPAGEIGLKEGDVIVAINGVPVDSRRDLRQEVWSNAPGDPFELTVLRGNDQPFTLNGNYGRIPEWIEQRLRLPGERWEDRVEARQRDYLDDLGRQLAAAESLLTALRAEQAQAVSSAKQGLPPLVFDGEPAAIVLGLVAEEQPWSFSFHWQHESVLSGEIEL